MITEQYDEIMDDLGYVAEHKTVKLGTYVKLNDVLKIIDDTYDKYEKHLPIEDFGRGMDITVRIKNAIKELKSNKTKIEPKIKPCPFCGGTLYLSAIWKGDELPIFVENYLKACEEDPELASYNVRFSCLECGITSQIYKTPVDAIEAWNRRYGQ